MSLDVALLYMSILHENVRFTIKEELEKREHFHPPTHFIFVLIDILLLKKYFRCDDEYYMQIKGVAMGSSFVPGTPNLFMMTLV